jgi:hypothetical protein
MLIKLTNSTWPNTAKTVPSGICVNLGKKIANGNIYALLYPEVSYSGTTDYKTIKSPLWAHVIDYA